LPVVEVLELIIPCVFHLENWSDEYI
jgi:hypothetical protein